jgi:hypothetical protein
LLVITFAKSGVEGAGVEAGAGAGMSFGFELTLY